MKLDFYGLTDIGRKREKNEDSLVINPNMSLFIVADGMGGHLGGEFASRLAVKTIEETVQRMLESSKKNIANQLPLQNLESGEILKHAIHAASQKIYEEADRNVNLKGMGTTAVALWIQGTKGFIAHVGDSRAYLIREGKIQQLTQDHSFVAEQLRAGFITEEELKYHKFRNIITRSVGYQSDVDADLQVRDLEEGDHFLLCSDGLTNLIEDPDLCRIVSKHEPKEACQRLIELANKKGGDDNITAIVASVESLEFD